MKRLLLLVAGGCGHAAPSIGNHGGAAGAAAGLPCGAATVEELDPYGQTAIGPCRVREIDGYYQLEDDGRPVMRAGESKPLVALDPRVPGPRGVRVGMTGAQAREQLPAYRWIECFAFSGRLQCEIRRVAETPGCGEGEPDDLVYIELDWPHDIRLADVLEGAAAWAAIEDELLTAVVLSMPC